PPGSRLDRPPRAARPEPRERRGPLALRRLVVVEPEEADGARPRVRADHGAERRAQLDLRLRTDVAHHLLELGEPLGSVGVREADAEARVVAGLRPERVDERLDRLPVSAHALHRHDLAVADREDRLHVHELAGEGLRAPDAAAAREVLERVDGEAEAVLAQVA